jgi:uracil-DNA glycosylase
MPTPQERITCAPYLRRELALLSDVRVVLVLGEFAFKVMTNELGLRPRPPFGHGVEAVVPDGRVLLCSFHPSRQNTNTRKLTEPMLDAVFARALELVDAR